MRVGEEILFERPEYGRQVADMESEFISFQWFCSTFAIKSTKTQPGIGTVGGPGFHPPKADRLSRSYLAWLEGRNQVQDDGKTEIEFVVKNI